MFYSPSFLKSSLFAFFKLFLCLLEPLHCCNGMCTFPWWMGTCCYLWEVRRIHFFLLHHIPEKKWRKKQIILPFCVCVFLKIAILPGCWVLSVHQMRHFSRRLSSINRLWKRYMSLRSGFWNYFFIYSTRNQVSLWGRWPSSHLLAW